MVLFVLAFLGGVLTILSPCILPILPFTFARADQPFRKSGLPLLLSMAVTFAAVASLAVVGGSWLVRANQYGRIAALIVFAILGLSLLWPAFAERLSRPFVQLGNRLTNSASSDSRGGVLQSLLLGVATGLLWAPCAGPILGLILAGAALQGASAHTTLLLFTYAVGSISSLAVALLAGGRVFEAMKRSLGAEEWIRRILGVAVLAGVFLVAFGLDRGLLTRLSLSSTSGVEQSLLDRFHPRSTDKPADQMTMTSNSTGGSTQVSVLAGLSGATDWINSPPLTADQLKGKVVLIDFWTYSCINCLRTLPYVRAWADKYKDSGLVVIGVHTPEFPFEKDLSNVQKAVHDFGITYPVAMDNNNKIWNAFSNQYWPAHYFIDANGKVRFHHFGEGNYDESERWIQDLLKERNAQQALPAGIVNVQAHGAEAAPDMDDVRSPETYVGYQRTQHFASPGGLNQDGPKLYSIPPQLELNQWALAGKWIDQGQIAVLASARGKIAFRFHARDLHLVLGPSVDGKPVRFRVTIDGKAPGENHGVDTNDNGDGIVTENRLYQLVRQKGAITDHTFTIEFLNPGVQAFAFTFG
ncbi:cytochrome c biogenesis protein DipZ [Tunturiibacter gelidoferens]|jgi:cytochrome c biogenesis protein CcdA/thiol-disulfide isomerase/thioredoxin|uniref:Cytochrome c biogenesis protein CcdA/thiol-disulfide isomerase/thioredoxin n=1 Tax=Tunturiibacter gelidiferens TaxID=3069689 RepID=A0A9X0QA43_9BACT|nr:cytochrome c biogenesis protein DipZ [Edaphobacter lichenicola]MBB5326488.1 cytochrome c biogenesis protein CcdA/thiol-disulfide isomerase/thioredoxin [Edaphobacter lichenicola]